MKLSLYVLAPLFFAIRGSTQVNPPIAYRGDTIQYQNYAIYQCPTQSDAVKSALTQLFAFLSVAIDELESGEALKTAPFQAFFGDEINGILTKVAADPNAVKKIFSLIANGQSIWKYGVQYHPTIVCVTPDNYWEYNEAWELCQQGFNIMWAIDSEVVVLCPGFFAVPKSYPTSVDCPKRDPTGLFLMGSDLLANQYAGLIQVLSQLYLAASGVPAVLPPAHNVNQCLVLPASEAIRNPTSYAYYAASVSAGCSQWPVTIQGRSGLEVDSYSDRETIGNVQLEACPNDPNLGLCPPPGKAAAPATLAV